MFPRSLLFLLLLSTCVWAVPTGSYLVGQPGREEFDIRLDFRGDRVIYSNSYRGIEEERALEEVAQGHYLVLHERGNAHLFWVDRDRFVMVIETSDQVLVGLRILDRAAGLRGRWELPARGQSLELKLDGSFSLESGEALVQGRYFPVAPSQPGSRAFVLQGPHGSELLTAVELKDRAMLLYQGDENFFFAVPAGRSLPSWMNPFVRPLMPEDEEVRPVETQDVEEAEPVEPADGTGEAETPQGEEENEG